MQGINIQKGTFKEARRYGVLALKKLKQMTVSWVEVSSAYMHLSFVSVHIKELEIPSDTVYASTFCISRLSFSILKCFENINLIPNRNIRCETISQHFQCLCTPGWFSSFFPTWQKFLKAFPQGISMRYLQAWTESFNFLWEEQKEAFSHVW